MIELLAILFFVWVLSNLIAFCMEIHRKVKAELLKEKAEMYEPWKDGEDWK